MRLKRAKTEASFTISEIQMDDSRVENELVMNESVPDLRNILHDVEEEEKAEKE
jgi:hypothetical protein